MTKKLHQRVKKILEWSHLGTHERIIIYLAKRMKIPINTASAINKYLSIILKRCNIF